MEVEVEVNELLPNGYTLRYLATDRAGNQSTVTRTIIVVDTTPLRISLKGEEQVEFDHGKSYFDEGASAQDIVDGTVPVSVSVSVNTQVLGSYELTYTASDSAGNSASQKRLVTVVDRVPPVISLIGEANVSLMVEQNYEDKGALASDALDGDIAVTSVSNVDMTQAGEYSVTYSASDSSGNQATLSRIVSVALNTVPPVVELNGQSIVNLFVGETFVDEGASATDDIDGTLQIEVDGEVNTEVTGEYTLT